MISRPVRSTSPRPKSATSKRSRSAGVIAKPARSSIRAAFSTVSRYFSRAIIGPPPQLDGPSAPLTGSVLKRDSISTGISVTGAARLAGRATDSQQLPHLHSYRLPPGHQDVLAAAHPEKRMWTRRLSIPRELFTDRRQINLLQNSSEVDLGHPR